MKAYLIISIMITDPAAHTQVVEYSSMDKCRVAMTQMIEIQKQAHVKYFNSRTIDKYVSRSNNAAFFQFGNLHLSLSCSEQ